MEKTWVEKTGYGLQVIGYVLLVIGCGFFLSSITHHPSPAFADIYSYTDDRGVIHFSNVPTSNNNWRVKIKEEHFDSRKLSLGGHDKLIYKAAEIHGIDPLLIKAIIRAESDFDPSIVSNKGAVGLMQLMPGTAGDMGVDNAFDPVQNIDGGVRYLKKLIGMYKSNLLLVLAAYNAGEGAVRKYKGIPPYRETQDYVRKVLQHFKAYKNAENTSLKVANR